MCDFFFKATVEPNTGQIFNVMFSRDERGSSYLDDENLYAVIKILWLHM